MTSERSDWLSCAHQNDPTHADKIVGWLSSRRLSLRSHQWAALCELRQHWMAGKRGVLVALPTGAGKTRLAAEVVRLERQAGRKVLVLVHRTDLVKQTCDALENHADVGLRKDETIGIWQGDAGKPSLHHNVHVATVQTLCCRVERPDADLVVVDEAHHFAGNSWENIVRAYPRARILMLSATPERPASESGRVHHRTSAAQGPDRLGYVGSLCHRWPLTRAESC